MQNILKFIIKKVFHFLLFICCLSTICSFVIQNKEVKAVDISLEESYLEAVDNLRYGYNVAGGKSLCDDALLTSAPILKPISDGLYKYVSKHESGSKTETGNHVTNTAVGISEKTGSVLSGGLNLNVSVVNLDISATFDTSTSLDNIYEERYELYYEKIIRYYYLIREDVDLREYLTDSFERELHAVSGKEEAISLFMKYGTHLFSGFQYGGLIHVTNYQATNSSSYNLSKKNELGAKIAASVKSMGGGTNFSFSEQYIRGENTEHKSSTYKCVAYGGNAISGMSLDHLFTYNTSLVDGKGQYEYGRWVYSINEGVNLAIVGVPSAAKSIPLWDLLPSDSSYNELRYYLIQGFSELCGDKYAEYLEKYPSSSRTIEENDENLGTVDIKGHSIMYNNNVQYIEDDDSVAEHSVYPKSDIFMNFTDTIEPGKKEWKVIFGSQYVEVLDSINGIFRVNENATVEGAFAVGLYNENNLLSDATYNFKIYETRFSGGDGSLDQPYLISSAEDLIVLARESSLWGKNYKLTNNIDMKDKNVGSIGNANNYFSGVFDGNYCTISNLSYTNGANEAIGLFAYSKGTLKNIFIDKVTIKNADDKYNSAIKYIGGLVGYNEGNVENCKIDTVDIAFRYNKEDKEPKEYLIAVGGLIGYTKGNKNVTNCSVSKVESVTGMLYSKEGQSAENSVYSGGLIGYAENTRVENSYVREIEVLNAQTQGKYVQSYVGGLIGKIGDNVKISNVIVGTISSIKAGTNAVGFFPNASSSKGSIIGNGDTAESTACYTLSNGDIGSGITNGCTTLNSITYEGCSSLSPSIWTKDADNFPILIKQTFSSSGSIIINVDDAKNEFYYGENFSMSGIKVEGKLVDSNELINIDTFNCDSSMFNPLQLGTQSIIIHAIGKTAVYKVNVRKINVVGLKIEPIVSTFYVGDSPSLSNFKISYILENGELIDINEETKDYIEYPKGSFNITSDSYVLGDNKIIISNGDITGSTIVIAEEKKLDFITINKKPNKLFYKPGETFNYEGMIVEAHYVDGSIFVIDNSELEIIGNKIISGTNEVIISYGSYVTCNITVYGKIMITFVNWDGSIISSKQYDPGEKIEIPNDPVRPDDLQYLYKFNGWDKEVSETCIDSAIYTATYISTPVEYTIKFVNWNGEVISEEVYKYGETVAIPANPIKPSDSQNNYMFNGWDKEVSLTCEGNATYTAIYTATPVEYTIKFVDWDGKTISEKTYKYGETIAIPANPTRPSDSQSNYMFNGWDKEVSLICEGNATYIATYASYSSECVVKFVDWDGKTISEKIYKYGDAVVKPSDPVRSSDVRNKYEFAGWDKEVSLICEGNATYTAIYTATPVEYTIKFVDWDGKTISEKTYKYGDAVVKPSDPMRQSNLEYTYKFNGWDKEVSLTCEGNATYTAIYTATPVEYTIKFVDWDGKTISEKTYKYGDVVVKPSNPVRSNDLYNTYKFSGWDKEVSVICTSSEIYVAVYIETSIEYTIKFVNWDGNTILEKKYHYGDTIEIPYDPSRPNDSSYRYTFAGWDKEIIEICNGNAKYIAIYDSHRIEKSGCSDSRNDAIVMVLSLVALSVCVMLLRKK